MPVRIRLKDIQVSQLNNECLRLVSRFVRVLKAHNGTQLRLQDRDVLVQISDHARNSQDEELKEIYARLKDEVRTSVYKSLKE